MPKKKSNKQIILGIQQENIAYMVMLAEYEPFQEDVAQIRKEFKVPPDGFYEDGEKNIAGHVESWRKENEMSNKEWGYLAFRNGKSPMDIYHKYLSFLAKPLANSLYESWHTRTEDLREKYFVPFHFQPYLEQFILTGIVTAPYTNHHLHSVVDTSKKGMTEVKLTVYGVPSDDEADYIARQLNPLKYIASGPGVEIKSPRTWLHPKDRYLRRKDIPAKEYAEILAHSRKKYERGVIRNDLSIATELFGAKNSLKQANRVKSIRRKAKNLQRKLFAKKGDTSPG